MSFVLVISFTFHSNDQKMSTICKKPTRESCCKFLRAIPSIKDGQSSWWFAPAAAECICRDTRCMMNAPSGVLTMHRGTLRACRNRNSLIIDAVICHIYVRTFVRRKWRWITELLFRFVEIYLCRDRRQNWNVIAINDGVPPCWYKNCVKWLSECIHHSCSDVDDAFGLCAIARGSGTCTFTGAPTEYFTSSSGFTRNNINLIGKTGPVFFLRVFLLHSLWYCS